MIWPCMFMNFRFGRTSSMDIVIVLDMHVQTGAGMTSVVRAVALGMDVIGWLVRDLVVC